MVTPSFLFTCRYQEHLLSSSFSAYFQTAQKYPCILIVGTIHRKPKYLKMHRTYGQQQTYAPSLSVQLHTSVIFQEVHPRGQNSTDKNFERAQR